MSTLIQPGVKLIYRYTKRILKICVMRRLGQLSPPYDPNMSQQLRIVKELLWRVKKTTCKDLSKYR